MKDVLMFKTVPQSVSSRLSTNRFV